MASATSAAGVSTTSVRGLGRSGAAAVSPASGATVSAVCGGVATEQLALPLGQRLVGGDGLLTGGGATGAGDEALGDGIRDDAGQEGDRTDRVVVARDLVVDLVGVAVGVEDRDDRQPQLAGLVHREVLLLGVDDPHGRGDPAHGADAAQGALELVALALEDEQLLLREAGAGHVVEVELLELLEAGEPLGDRLEVGEHATEPAVVDVRHPDPGRLLGDRLLRLALGADEQDGAAVGDGLA